MIGNTENEFKPQDNVTKEELIITLLRIYDSMSTVGVETK
jgi:hypothetical protein